MRHMFLCPLNHFVFFYRLCSQEAKLATDQFLTGLMREQSDQVDGSKGVVDNGEGALEVPDES